MFEQQLEQWLVPFKTARQRAVFIFTPHNQQQRKVILAQLAAALPSPLWLSDTSSTGAKMHRYRDYLGLTARQVVLDFDQLIHADALAALTGTVIGGGCLWLVLPIQPTSFQQRLVAHAENYTSIISANSWSAMRKAIRQTPPHFANIVREPNLPSSAQQVVIDALLNDTQKTHVLLADRGRGKSTTLGLAIKQARLHQPILVTGPRPAALATLLKEAGPAATFRAWDRLLREESNHGQPLVIDEAAAIPLHCLQQLLMKFRVWAVATTVDGYEGCGQGFVLRFMSWLNSHFDVREHRLDEPLRWSPEDGCEAWLNDALLLRTSTDTKHGIQTPHELKFEFCHASELDEDDLSQTMTLLLEAHYQSSPNDLRLLLDDPAQHLLLARCAAEVVGVVWLATEGPIASELQGPIMTGKRRLKGHLLPQALGFYRQQSACLDWTWWRITRIAVTHTQRRSKIGSKMLDHVIRQAKQRAIDALGTSFGVTPEVLNFWQQSPLREVRRGLKKNAASGTVSAIWALGLTPEAAMHVQALAAVQQAEQAWMHDIPVDAPASAQAEIFSACITILRGFSQAALPFSDARFAWWMLATHHHKLSEHLTELLQPDTPIANLIQNYRVASRSELEQQLRVEAHDFLHSINAV
ncbi:GNAT family N-acetyltransferase [Pseudidiomarina sp.]|uniref:GNAT family N-acetyltransferase n=1 Tax=Pseudidiomarina sp. TaxID=2081707 RepID=UPI003A96B798